MPKEKRSLFERLTGTVKVDREPSERSVAKEEALDALDLDDATAELTIDLHQTADSIIIKTMAAGVRPEDLDINITRDMVTISGSRETERGIKADDYLVQELYWGAFSRTITLPSEVEPEDAEATEKHGLLIIKIPKVNKGKQTKLKIKTS